MTFGKLRPLRKVTVFKALVNLSTYKYSKHDACIEAARLAYSWIYDKYGHLDGDLPTEPMTFEKNLLGYRLVIVYEPEHDYWKMNCMHIDMEFLCGVRGAQRLFKPLFQLSEVLLQYCG